MKKILSFLFVLLISFNCLSQKENANWCFWQNARINFLPSLTTSTCAVSYTYPNPYGGSCASVSDRNGQLLFYTDGIKVWDRNNIQMPNGINLNGRTDPLYNRQTTIIVPKPQHEGIYYIFTVNACLNTVPTGHAGLNYSMVDMNLNGGMGDVTTVKNIVMKDEAGVPMDYNYQTGAGLRIYAHRITSTLHFDKDKIWVTFFTRFNQTSTPKRIAYSYLVSTTGINNTADGTSPGPTNFTLLNNANFTTTTYPFEGGGVIKISPDGSKLVDAIVYNLNIYNFDNRTGAVVFNNTMYTGAGQSHPAGAEFSPNGQFVYFSNYSSQIYQGKNNSNSLLDDQEDINVQVLQYQIDRGITTLIGKYKIPANPQSIVSPIGAANTDGDLQLAIDNKIYVCSKSITAPVNGNLSVIQNPDIMGIGCNFSANSLSLAPSAHEGNLPQLVCRDIWPKVYNGKGNQNLIKDATGNIYMSVHELSLVDNPVNHFGFQPPPLSPITNNYEQYTMNYIPSNTSCTWGRALLAPAFALNAGTIQFSDNTFCNASTGVTVAAPTLVPVNERIIAEIGNPTTTFITKKDYQLWIHNSAANPSVAIAYSIRSKFNPASNKLYVWEQNTPSSGLGQLKIFTVTGTSFGPPVITGFPAGTDFVGVDNADRIFLIVSGVLKQFTFPGTYTTVSISGFTNSNIARVSSDNPYTENRYLVLNQTEKNLYSIDLGLMTEKKVHQGNSGIVFSYVYDGNFIYLAGFNQSLDFPIGPQTISPLLNHQNCFFTKVSLLNDFTLKPSAATVVGVIERPASFNVSLVPNPVTADLFKIEITENNKKTISLYTVSVINQMGRTVVRKENYLQGNNLSLYGLEKGIYYVEVMNNNGEKVSRTTVKL